jgi:hypothetical protein
MAQRRAFAFNFLNDLCSNGFSNQVQVRTYLAARERETFGVRGARYRLAFLSILKTQVAALLFAWLQNMGKLNF